MFFKTAEFREKPDGSRNIHFGENRTSGFGASVIHGQMDGRREVLKERKTIFFSVRGPPKCAFR